MALAFQQSALRAGAKQVQPAALMQQRQRADRLQATDGFAAGSAAAGRTTHRGVPLTSAFAGSQGVSRRAVVVRASASRPLWRPGSTPPAHLKGE